MFFQETIAAYKTFPNEKYDKATETFYAITLKNSKNTITERWRMSFTQRHAEQQELFWIILVECTHPCHTITSYLKTAAEGSCCGLCR